MHYPIESSRLCKVDTVIFPPFTSAWRVLVIGLESYSKEMAEPGPKQI